MRKKIKKKRKQKRWGNRYGTGVTSGVALYDAKKTSITNTFILEPSELVVNIKMTYGKGKHSIERRQRLKGSFEKVMEKLDEMRKER